MAVAFVLISSETGVEGEVLKRLLMLDCVSEVHVVYGVYDILAKVESNSLPELKETIERQIRYLDHVVATVPLLVAEPSLVTDKRVPVAQLP